MELQKFDELPELPDDEEVPEKTRPYLEEVRSLRKYPVPNYPMFIGRDKKGSVCLPIPAVSRKHAKVFEREGVFYVQDMGSINGTYLNDKRILDPVELHDGDRIKLAITKEFPQGAREFTFRCGLTSEKQAEDADRDSMLKAAGIGGARGDAKDAKKVLLRYCIFKVSRGGIASVLKSDATKRVALSRLHLGHKIVHFQSLSPFKLKETVVFSIEHPKLSETLKFTIRINKITEIPMKVQEHEAEIIKVAERHAQIYNSMIKESPLICYVTSQLKE